MWRFAQAGWLLGLLLALAACQSNGRIRVYVEPTYEQDKLQQMLGVHPDVRLLLMPGTEDVSVRVEAVRQPVAVRTLRAAVRVRARRTGYEVHAVAELLPRRSEEGPRARWVNSYSRGVYEDTFAEILHQIVVEAARAQHRDFQRSPEEVERAAAVISAPPAP